MLLTKVEERILELICEDVQMNFFIAVRKNDYDAINTAVKVTHELLIRLMDKIMKRTGKT